MRVIPVCAAGAVLSFLLFNSGSIQAQALEEIVVTAQRRTQTLQEVPISMELYDSEEIRNQGFRDMSFLADFSPGMVIEKDQSQGGTNVFIRGFGTAGRNLTVAQAAPTFLDNIPLSRSSQNLLAFLDVERVEVLKGPQPVYFGQNATAGAISIVSARPTEVWEGYANAELGFYSTDPVAFKTVGNHKLEAAAGGPITDTVGIRVAGKYEASDGFMRDIVWERPVGYYSNLAGRFMLDWEPSDRFRVQTKLEYGQLGQDPEGLHLCRTEGPSRLGRNDDPNDVDIFDPDIEGDELSVWLDYPQGSGSATPHTPLGECFASEDASPRDAIAPPWNIRNTDDSVGTLDIRGIVDESTRDFFQSSSHGALPREDLELLGGYVNMSYSFDNGIEVNWLTGYQDYLRNVMRPNRHLPFIQNVHHREEGLIQTNSELRVQSPTGGTFEWMAGAYWQDENLDLLMHLFSSSPRRGYRQNIIHQDSRWLSAFGTLTFNFNQFSLDLGARYTDANVFSYINTRYGGQYIFDTVPCAGDDDDFMGPEFADFDTDTCTLADGATPLAAADASFLMSQTPEGRVIDTNNLWYLEWLETRDTPSTWRSPLNAPVGLQLLPGVRLGTDGSYLGDDRLDSSDSDFDPQIVLRYRLNDDNSFFAKYATSWKIGGVDTGVGGVPDNPEEVLFDSEFAEVFEVGAKGRYLDGRATYEVTLFQLTFTDMQTGTGNPDPEEPTSIINIGEQRARGVDFATRYAISDRLILGLTGTVMDAELVVFPNSGCTGFEFNNPELTGCDVDTETIDRSGQTPPYSPTWAFTADIDYWMPVIDDRYRLSLNSKITAKDEYHRDAIAFSKTITSPAGADLNLNVGFGDIADKWRVTLSARHLLEQRLQYNSDQDTAPAGVLVTRLPENMVRAFALQYRHNF